MADQPVQQHQDQRLDRREPRREVDSGPGGPGELVPEAATLRDLRDGELVDEDGDDVRMYTGEPVETEDGWVLPQQQNLAGRDNIAGGGEWPDTDAPPAQPPPDED